MMPVPVMTMVVLGENGTGVIEYEDQFGNRFGMDCISLYIRYCNNCTRLLLSTFMSGLLLNSRYCLYWYTTYRGVLGSIHSPCF